MSQLSVLTVYNAYLNRGGEDEVFDAEADLLERHGHTVHRLRVEADDLRQPGKLKQAQIAAETIWSPRGYQRLRGLMRELRPDVVHFHNTFPLLSPSAYAACKREGATVVHTLHNYRMVCPANTLYRDGHPCQDCVGRFVPVPAVQHACYHDSHAQTGVIASMLAMHKLRGTWRKDIDLYITPTEFARRIFIRGGIEAGQITVKPNFIDYQAPPRPGAGNAFLLVGRLVQHKGVATVLDAWQRLPDEVPLRIIGDGPMAPEVERFAQAQANITYLGRQPREAVLQEMLAARAFIFPSTWYETFGITIVEAFASGLPVIASDIGPIGSELVSADRTGLLFPPGDAGQLASRVDWAWRHPDEMAHMGANARADYEARFTGSENYRQLIALYELAMSRAGVKKVSAPKPVPA